VSETKGGIGVTDLLTKWRALPLMWTEALRALVCLVPMMVATVLGQTTYLVTFAVSSAPWAAPRWRRAPWRLSPIRRSSS
jgi:hypothetical protein